MLTGKCQYWLVMPGSAWGGGGGGGDQQSCRCTGCYFICSRQEKELGVCSSSRSIDGDVSDWLQWLTMNHFYYLIVIHVMSHMWKMSSAITITNKVWKMDWTLHLDLQKVQDFSKSYPFSIFGRYCWRNYNTHTQMQNKSQISIDLRNSA